MFFVVSFLSIYNLVSTTFFLTRDPVSTGCPVSRLALSGSCLYRILFSFRAHSNSFPFSRFWVLPIPPPVPKPDCPFRTCIILRISVKFEGGGVAMSSRVRASACVWLWVLALVQFAESVSFVQAMWAATRGQTSSCSLVLFVRYAYVMQRRLC
jgi:hypothetical protein